MVGWRDCWFVSISSGIAKESEGFCLLKNILLKKSKLLRQL